MVGGGGGGVSGPKNFFFTKFNQIWCVSNINGTCNSTNFWVPTPWGGAKRSNIIKSQSQSQFQRFLNQTLCVFSQLKKYKIYQTGFSFRRLGHAPGVGLEGTVGGGVSKNFFSQIQPDLVCELFT